MNSSSMLAIDEFDRQIHHLYIPNEEDCGLHFFEKSFGFQQAWTEELAARLYNIISSLEENPLSSGESGSVTFKFEWTNEIDDFKVEKSAAGARGFRFISLFVQRRRATFRPKDVEALHFVELFFLFSRRKKREQTEYLTKEEVRKWADNFCPPFLHSLISILVSLSDSWRSLFCFSHSSPLYRWV